MRESIADRLLVPCLLIAGCIAYMVQMKQDAIVLMLYAIGITLTRIEGHVSRRAGARGESNER